MGGTLVARDWRWWMYLLAGAVSCGARISLCQQVMLCLDSQVPFCCQSLFRFVQPVLRGSAFNLGLDDLRV